MVSRKLAKPVCLILLLILILPGSISSPLWGGSPIKTIQRTVVIDPGHGGVDKGLEFSSGATEKKLALNLSLITAKILSEKYNVVLTRTGDVQVPSALRTAVANERKADLFVSIHLHAQAGDQGFVFYYDAVTAPFPKTSALWKHQALHHREASKDAAVFFAEKLKTILGTDFFVIPVPAPVLEGALMPAMMLEVSGDSLFSGPETDKKRHACARKIARGIDLCLKSKIPIKTRK